MEDKWKEIKSVAIYIAVVLVLFIFSLYGISRMQSCEGLNEPKRLIVIDTQVVVRYKDEVKRDTVWMWYSGIGKKISEPVKELMQRVDSATAEQIKRADAMLRVEKADGKLKIYAYRANDTVMKYYEYDDVGRGFTITSIDNDLRVESERWYWQGFRLKAGMDVQGMDFKAGYRPKVGIETGIEYQGKTGIDAGVFYDGKRKDFELHLQWQLKLK
jgi:hypothetical protein